MQAAPDASRRGVRTVAIPLWCAVFTKLTPSPGSSGHLIFPARHLIPEIRHRLSWARGSRRQSEGCFIDTAFSKRHDLTNISTNPAGEYKECARKGSIGSKKPVANRHVSAEAKHCYHSHVLTNQGHEQLIGFIGFIGSSERPPIAHFFTPSGLKWQDTLHPFKAESGQIDEYGFTRRSTIFDGWG